MTQRRRRTLVTAATPLPRGCLVSWYAPHAPSGIWYAWAVNGLLVDYFSSGSAYAREHFELDA